MSNPQSITITMPLPPRILSPNGRGHWAAKSKARASQRAAAFGYASAQVRGAGPKWPRTKLTIRWFAADKGKIPDVDNMIASAKGILDGMADAGAMLNDRGIESVDLWRNTDLKNPRVEVTITEIVSPFSA